MGKDKVSVQPPWLKGAWCHSANHVPALQSFAGLGASCPRPTVLWTIICCTVRLYCQAPNELKTPPKMIWG